ncbi:MAG: hypothetical protein Q4C52_11955 [Eubacteriales bacterium]|nr:hypothetical protein [Eubacteriales bacterium]
MADYVMTAERLNALKAKVKEEMARRTATEHNASLSDYAGDSWDFETKDGEPITDEHVQKIIDPLLEVNDFLYDNSFRTGKSGLELSVYRADKFVDEISAIDKIAQDTGCRGNCTGLCYAACYSACTGCTSCSGSCSTTCGKQCAEGCEGGCTGCTGGCCNSCTNTCGSGCTTGAKS